MGEFTTDNNQPVLSREYADQRINNLANIKRLRVGNEDKVFSLDVEQGLFLGAKVFADAPFSVDFSGNIKSVSTNGSGSIIISGAGKNIIVNDGVNDRVLLGYGQNLF